MIKKEEKMEIPFLLFFVVFVVGWVGSSFRVGYTSSSNGIYFIINIIH
jgi:hypothetical protein